MLARVQVALKEIRKTEARLARMADELEVKLPLLQDQARLAVRKGREDLARNALERRGAAEIELDNIKVQFEEVELEGRRLSLVENRLSTQIESFYARQEVIAARYSAAEAQVQIQEALSGLSEELVDLGKTLELTEERTTRMQARAYAIDRLVEDGLLGTPTAREISMDLTPAPAIERQLEALKREVSSEGNSSE